MAKKSDLAKKAFEYIKKSKRVLVDGYANPSIFVASETPITVFMAGAPGVGKTEFSKKFIIELNEDDPTLKIVRIDADEIREKLPGYKGENSSDFQRAASKGVSILFDHIQKKSLNAVVDGTFSNHNIARENIDRSLNKNRAVGVFFLYQNPIVAWDFTKKREVMEKRKITPKVFAQTYFDSMNCVNKMKEEFGKKMQLDMVIQNRQNKLKKIHLNIEKVDGYIKDRYTMGSLMKILK